MSTPEQPSQAAKDVLTFEMNLIDLINERNTLRARNLSLESALKQAEEALKATSGKLESLSNAAYGEKGPPERVLNILGQSTSALASLRAVMGKEIK